MPTRGRKKKSTFHRKRSLDFFVAALPEGLAESARQIVQDGSELNLQHLAEQIYSLACKELSPEDLEQVIVKAEKFKADHERERTLKRKRSEHLEAIEDRQ